MIINLLNLNYKWSNIYFSVLILWHRSRREVVAAIVGCSLSALCLFFGSLVRDLVATTNTIMTTTSAVLSPSFVNNGQNGWAREKKGYKCFSGSLKDTLKICLIIANYFAHGATFYFVFLRHLRLRWGVLLWILSFFGIAFFSVFVRTSLDGFSFVFSCSLAFPFSGVFCTISPEKFRCFFFKKE